MEINAYQKLAAEILNDWVASTIFCAVQDAINVGACELPYTPECGKLAIEGQR